METHPNQYRVNNPHNKEGCITLFNHVDRFHHPGICQLYSMGPQTNQEYSFFIYIFMLNLEICVELGLVSM